jgi:presenilin-like A22 family membrane protease
MKHNIKITLIILGLFLLTQIISLFVSSVYFFPDHNGQNVILPYGMQPAVVPEEINFWAMLPTLVISFAIAIFLIFLLTRYHWNFIIKFWFFSVVCLALAISLNAFFVYSNLFQGIVSFLFWSGIPSSWLVSLIITIPLSFLKIYHPRVLVHNFTEILIYPGISAVFIPILNIPTIILLLILISVYDMWAVWHSGVMQKMAKYQMNELKIFAGLFIPYITKEMRNKIARFKKTKNKKGLKKIKIATAILGGGDIVFPAITAGVFLKLSGIVPALFVIFGAFLGLSLLLVYSEKKKFYPAMPFITAGIFLGLLVWLLSFGM